MFTYVPFLFSFSFSPFLPLIVRSWYLTLSSSIFSLLFFLLLLIPLLVLVSRHFEWFISFQLRRVKFHVMYCQVMAPPWWARQKISAVLRRRRIKSLIEIPCKFIELMMVIGRLIPLRINRYRWRVRKRIRRLKFFDSVDRKFLFFD